MATPGVHHPWVEVCKKALFTSGILVQVPSNWLILFTLSLVIFTYGRKQEEKRKLSWKFSKITALSLGLIKTSLWRPYKEQPKTQMFNSRFFLTPLHAFLTSALVTLPLPICYADPSTWSQLWQSYKHCVRRTKFIPTVWF